MTTTTAVAASGVFTPVDTAAQTPSRPAITTWHARIIVAALACIPIGLIWDISWHISIGRDTFWTPAHLTIQFGGVLPALLGAWQAARITFFGTAADRASAVRFWGAYGPFGGWVAMWGALAMLTSAPFDDWWHNTYGLDVKIISPPHAVLGIGMQIVALGGLLSVLSWQNRASEAEQAAANRLFAIVSGVMITIVSVFATEFTWPNRHHSAGFYRLLAVLYPFLLLTTARASKHRWAATLAAGTYTGIMLLMVWGLPWFRAQPMLAPIYHPVDHMIPPPLPMLLVVPAVAIDLLMRLFGKGKDSIPSTATTSNEDKPAPRWWKSGWFKDWGVALATGMIFLGLILAAQWYFTQFVFSPAGDIALFPRRITPYYDTPGRHLREFGDAARDPLTLAKVGGSALCAWLSARLGLALGNWMRLVRR